jgi:hypothetical protein
MRGRNDSGSEDIEGPIMKFNLLLSVLKLVL